MAAPLLARHPCSARHGGAIRAREQTVPGLHPSVRSQIRWLRCDSKSTTRAAAISFESDAEVREPSSNGTPSEEIPFQIPHQLLQAPMFQPGTIAVHGGEREGRPRVSDSLTTPIVQTSTYTFRNTTELLAYQEGTYGSYEYGRYGNPTSRTCEEKIRSLEEAEDCLVSTSGMNSATTLLLALVPAGGHIVTTTDCYRRTRQFIQTLLPKMGITATGKCNLIYCRLAWVHNRNGMPLDSIFVTGCGFPVYPELLLGSVGVAWDLILVGGCVLRRAIVLPKQAFMEILLESV